MSEHAWTEAGPRFRAAGSLAGAQSVNTANMVRIPGGTFRMGSEKHYPEEGPVHRVTVSDFRINRYRPAARHAQPIDTSTSHVGFRCVVRAHKNA